MTTALLDKPDVIEDNLEVLEALLRLPSEGAETPGNSIRVARSCIVSSGVYTSRRWTV